MNNLEREILEKQINELKKQLVEKDKEIQRLKEFASDQACRRRGTKW